MLVYGRNLLDVFVCTFGGRVAVATETHGRNRLACITDAFNGPGWVPLQLAEVEQLAEMLPDNC